MTDQELCCWIRRRCLELTMKAGKGHLGGSLSAVEIFVTLYKHILRSQDKILISKGHSVLALYPLYEHLGWLTKEQIDNEYYANGTFIGGQITTKLPHALYNSGSLGHCLGIGAGIALAAKRANKDEKVYVVMGDAECQEGSVWEAANFIGQHKLNNLMTIVDYNQLGVTGSSSITEEQLIERFGAFGWITLTCDGHNIQQLRDVLITHMQKPVCILARTVKGKGLSFMENQSFSHHSVPTPEQYMQAIKELQ